MTSFSSFPYSAQPSGSWSSGPYSPPSSQYIYDHYGSQDSPLSISSGSSDYGAMSGSSYPNSPRGGSYNPFDDIYHTGDHSASHHNSPDSNNAHQFICLVEGCTYVATRAYDLTRHMNARHKSLQQLADSGKMYDCPSKKCHSKGVHGFKRKDHLRDHTRRMHGRELDEDARLGKNYSATEKKPRKSKHPS